MDMYCEDVSVHTEQYAYTLVATCFFRKRPLWSSVVSFPTEKQRRFVPGHFVPGSRMVEEEWELIINHEHLASLPHDCQQVGCLWKRVFFFGGE